MLGSSLSSLNHLIRPQQVRLRDVDAERLGGLEVDDHFELRGLLEGMPWDGCRLRTPCNRSLGATLRCEHGWPTALRNVAEGQLSLVEVARAVFLPPLGSSRLDTPGPACRPARPT